MSETYRLVVTRPFGEYERGAIIEDAAEIMAVLADHPHDVVRVERVEG